MNIPVSVRTIGRSAFRECTCLGDVYYAGNEEDWDKVSIDKKTDYEYDDDGNDPLLNATIHYNSTGLETKAYFVFRGNTSERFEVTLEEQINSHLSTVYDPELAYMLMAMCDSVKSDVNIRKTFTSFGFIPESIRTNYDMSKLWQAYGMAKKQVGDQTVVLVVLRGTQDGWEIADDILGYVNPDNGEQSGFAYVANNLYNEITASDFLVGTDLSKTKYVFTGFSRGAAVANLLAKRFVDAGVPQDSIYTYTFACPDSFDGKNNDANRYSCIFNISDVNDFISWSPSGWLVGHKDWTKYGQSYWFAQDWIDYKNLEMRMDFKNIHNEGKYLEYLSKRKPVNEYRSRSAAKAILDNAADQRSKDFWANVLYGRYYQVGDVVVACPVNIDIYVSEKLVGTVTNNLPQVLDSSKVYISVVDDKKEIYLLSDDLYTFELTAIGEGTMTYTAKNIDVETECVITAQMFENVALMSGKRFISSVHVEGNIIKDVQTHDVKLYVIGEDRVPEKEVLPDGEGTEVPITTPDEPDEPDPPVVPDKPDIPDIPSRPSAPRPGLPPPRTPQRPAPPPSPPETTGIHPLTAQRWQTANPTRAMTNRLNPPHRIG